jgi:hypothetical protein
MIAIVAGMLTYYAFGAPNMKKPEAAYDVKWENNAQGLTYFCNRTSDIMNCDVRECYTLQSALSSETFCRGIGAPQLTFVKAG